MFRHVIDWRLGLLAFSVVVGAVVPAESQATGSSSMVFRVECDSDNDQFSIEPFRLQREELAAHRLDEDMLRRQAQVLAGVSTYYRIDDLNRYRISQICKTRKRIIRLQVTDGHLAIEETANGTSKYVKVDLNSVLIGNGSNYRLESNLAGEWRGCAGHGNIALATCLKLPLGGSANSTVGASASMPSFDCRAASGRVEDLICHSISGRLGALDVTMVQAFDAARKHTSDDAAFITGQRKWLAERGTGCDVPAYDRHTPLWQSKKAEFCVRGKYEQRIAELRQAAGDADPFRHLTTDLEGAVSSDADRNKVLDRAARWGDLLTLKTVLSGGGDLTLAEALRLASVRGSLVLTKVLVEAGANPNEVIVFRDGASSTALRQAIELDNRDVATYLLDHGGDIFIPAKDDVPPLTLAAMTGREALVARALATHPDLDEHGTYHLAGDRKGKTALMEAAERGYGDVVRLLLEAGADPNAVSGDRQTALHKAAFDGYAAIVTMLLHHGANPNMDSEVGAPLLLASDIDVVRELLDAGADMNADADDRSGVKIGDGLLLSAADRCDGPLVALLLERGADPSATNNLGQTARQVWSTSKRSPHANRPWSAWEAGRVRPACQSPWPNPSSSRQ